VKEEGERSRSPSRSSTFEGWCYLTLNVVTMPSWMCRGTSQTTWMVPFFLKTTLSVAVVPAALIGERFPRPTKSLLCGCVPTY
jgi:hypothetical protein